MAQKAPCDQRQRQAWQDTTFIPIAHILQPTARRTLITGIPDGFAKFWQTGRREHLPESSQLPLRQDQPHAPCPLLEQQSTVVVGKCMYQQPWSYPSKKSSRHKSNIANQSN